MNNWKIIPSIVLATVLIFGAGVFTGGLLVNYVKRGVSKKSSNVITNVVVCPTNTSAASPTNTIAKLSPPLPEIFTKPFLSKLDEQLRLTSDQHKAVEKIIDEGQDSIKKAVRSSRLEIRELLKPEQLKQFDLLMKRSPPKNNSGTNGASSGTGAPSALPVIEKPRIDVQAAAEANALPISSAVPTNSSPVR